MTEKTPRILVVDDVADAANTLATLLRLWGYDAAVAYDAATALQVARDFGPRLVLLDVGMPKMDGFQLALLLREAPGLANVPLIAVSGHTDERHRVRASELGFAQYVVKPTDPERLRALLAGIEAPTSPKARRTVVRPPQLLSTTSGLGD